MERFSSDARVSRALQEGVDLREYTRQVESELKKVEESAVQDYGIIYGVFVVWLLFFSSFFLFLSVASKLFC